MKNDSDIYGMGVFLPSCLAGGGKDGERRSRRSPSGMPAVVGSARMPGCRKNTGEMTDCGATRAVRVDAQVRP